MRFNAVEDPAFTTVLPAVMKISTDAYDIIEQFDHHHSPERYLTVSHFSPDSTDTSVLFHQQIQQIQNYSTDTVFRNFLWTRTTSSIKDLSEACEDSASEAFHCEALLQDLVRVDAWSPFEQSLAQLSRNDGCGFKAMQFEMGLQVRCTVCFIIATHSMYIFLVLLLMVDCSSTTPSL